MDIRASEDTLSDLYDRAPVGYMTVAADGTVTHANQTLLDLIGRPAPELLGQRWQELLLTKAGRTFVDTHVEPLLGLQHSAREISLDLVAASGQRLPVLLYIEEEAVLTGATQRIAVVPTADRRRYETALLEAKQEAEDSNQALRELTTELEQRVAARTADLRAANEELDTFSSAVSHELRAPIRALLGFTEALREDFGAQLSPQAHGCLARMDESVNRMADLIDGLLELSTGSRSALHPQSVDLSAVARQVLEQLAKAEPGRTVSWEIEPQLRVTADPRLMEIVMRNLLGNAWKYTARTPAARIRVYAEHGERPWICVADNGAGFDPRRAHLLFLPFQRLHEARQFAGTGIGLSTVRRILRRHGGDIAAHSGAEGGATFRFWLPS